MNGWVGQLLRVNLTTGAIAKDARTKLIVLFHSIFGLTYFLKK